MAFNWKAACFLCCQPTGANDINVHAVATLVIRDSLMKCGTDHSDLWAVQVSGKLQACNDLVAEEAIYHRNCYTRFTHGRSTMANDVTGQPGRKVDVEMLAGFDCICEFLESRCDNELFTLDDLRNIALEKGFSVNSV